jgi:ribulose 1,5-bisphosphate carboxylase large subunit-like protein
MLTRRFPIALAVAAVMATMAMTHATNAAADTKTNSQGAMHIVMLEKLYRVDGLQFDHMPDIMKYLNGRKPAQINIDVCRITGEADVSTFHREVQRIYAGTVKVRRLEKNALECSWNSSRLPPRST